MTSRTVQNRKDIANELRKTHFLLGTENKKFDSQYRKDFPQHSIKPQLPVFNESNTLRKTHFVLGDFKNPYHTTTMEQNKNMGEGRSYSIAKLEQSVKNDLRKSHFILGNHEPNYKTVSRSEFYNKSDFKDKTISDAKAIEKVLRSHNYVLGNDKPDYMSESQAKFVQPNFAENRLRENKTISTHELQKSHYVFGTNSDNPWVTTTQMSFYPKDIQTKTATKDTSKTNFVLGEDKPDFKSVHHDTFVPHQCSKSNESKVLSQELRKHHFVFGNEMADNNSSIQMQDFKNPSLTQSQDKMNKLNPHMLRASHFALGDKCQESINQYETTYATTMQPKQRHDPYLKENVNLISSMNLGKDQTSSFQTENRANFPFKKNEISTNEIKEMKRLVNNIKRHHWSLGDNQNDFKTTTGATYSYDFEKARNAKGNLDAGLQDDLRATHYKLGYMGNSLLTTHQATFVPVPVEKRVIHDPKLRESHIKMNDQKRNVFDSKSMYMVDYLKN